MKKFVIATLTVLAFTLVGCGKSEKKKCEEDENKEWVDGQCIDKADASEVFVITNKVAANITVASGNLSVSLAENACVKVQRAQFGKLKISTSATTEICGTNKKCPDADHYDIVAKDNIANSELQKVDKPDDSNCEELSPAEYSIIHDSDASSVTVASGNSSATLEKGECVTLKKSHFDKLKITWKGAWFGGGTVCDNTDTSERKCPSPGYFTHFTLISNQSVVDDTEAPDEHRVAIVEKSTFDTNKCTKQLENPDDDLFDVGS